jgi:hypothetical protein
MFSLFECSGPIGAGHLDSPYSQEVRGFFIFVSKLKRLMLNFCVAQEGFGKKIKI